MESTFPKSAPLLNELATATSQRKPEGSPQNYIDQGFAIIINASAHHRSLQENAIRQELKMQRDYVDKRLEALYDELYGQREYMDNRFEQVGRRFEAVDRRFEAVDRRFDGVDRKFQEQREYMDHRFEQMDRRFEQVTAAVHQLRAMTTNSKADRGIKVLQEVGAYQPDRGYCVPENFPKTVGDFWRLKKKTRLPQLISLSLFYGVTREELVEPDMDDDDPEAPTRQYTSLTIKQLVEKFPDLAHMALADRFGLKYRKVAAFMQRLEEFQLQITGKRATAEEVAGTARKTARIESVPQTETSPLKSEPPKSSPPYRPFSQGEGIPLELLLKNSASSPDKIPSDRTKLGWSETSERKRFQARLAEREGIEREEEQNREAGRTTDLPYQVVPAALVSDSSKSASKSPPGQVGRAEGPGSGDTEPFSSPIRFPGEQAQIVSRPQSSKSASKSPLSQVERAERPGSGDTEPFSSPIRLRGEQSQLVSRPKSSKSQSSGKGKAKK